MPADGNTDEIGTNLADSGQDRTAVAGTHQHQKNLHIVTDISLVGRKPFGKIILQIGRSGRDGIGITADHGQSE